MPHDALHPWRTDPALQSRLHPQYPDDLQIIAHQGGPRLTPLRPELIWVRITALTQPTPPAPPTPPNPNSPALFAGTILNTPHKLTAIKLNDTIQFFVPAGGQHPIMAYPQYLAERANWTITPCTKCGLSELFDPPSQLIKVIFPTAPEISIVSFTTFCPLCGGIQVASSNQPPPST